LNLLDPQSARNFLTVCGTVIDSWTRNCSMELVSLYVCMYSYYVYICVYVCMYVYVCVCMYVCMHVCMCTYVCMCMHVCMRLLLVFVSFLFVPWAQHRTFHSLCCAMPDVAATSTWSLRGT
jgi:nuclear pore complex protein Nup62